MQTCNWGGVWFVPGMRGICSREHLCALRYILLHFLQNHVHSSMDAFFKWCISLHTIAFTVRFGRCIYNACKDIFAFQVHLGKVHLWCIWRLHLYFIRMHLERCAFSVCCITMHSSPSLHSCAFSDVCILELVHTGCTFVNLIIAHWRVTFAFLTHNILIHSDTFWAGRISDVSHQNASKCIEMQRNAA